MNDAKDSAEYHSNDSRRDFTSNKENISRQAAGRLDGSCAGEALKRAKYLDLASVHEEIVNVKNHLMEVFDAIGARHTPSDKQLAEGGAASCNLVEVMEQLPGMVNRECLQIHKILNDFRDSLV